MGDDHPLCLIEHVGCNRHGPLPNFLTVAFCFHLPSAPPPGHGSMVHVQNGNDTAFDLHKLDTPSTLPESALLQCFDFRRSNFDSRAPQWDFDDHATFSLQEDHKHTRPLLQKRNRQWRHAAR